MNKAAKKRLVLVGLVIVIVGMLLFAFLGTGGVSTSLSVAEASSGAYDGKKVQVAGAVVQDSYSTDNGAAVFSICDDTDPSKTLEVIYTGAMSATFGNGVTAICTGMMEGTTLRCNEMVTKCPSKYESAEGALTVSMLMQQASTYTGSEVKVAGYLAEGTLKDVSSDIRFTLTSQGARMDVAWDGAMPDGCVDGDALVVSGILDSDGVFQARDVALDSDVN